MADIQFVKCGTGWRLHYFPAAQHGPLSILLEQETAVTLPFPIQQIQSGKTAF